MQTDQPLRSSAKYALREYLRGLSFGGYFGVTLTLRQGDHMGRLDEIEASKNLRHFMNRLNSEVFGKAFKRFGKRLQIVPVLERSSSGRLHYHLILENPYRETPVLFERMIEKEWAKTRYGFREVHVHYSVDQGWVDYITKFKSASDGIDWENFHQI